MGDCMMAAKAHRWGGSMGLLISRKEAEMLNIREGDELLVDIVKKENPLKELFGFGKGKTGKTAEEAIGQTRKEFMVD